MGANPNLLGVYYLGDKGEFEYVGGKIVDGFIVVHVSHFSKYAVLEYSRQFDDVDSKKWYAKDITAAAEAGIVNGRTITIFAPEDTLTRQEMTSC